REENGDDGTALTYPSFCEAALHVKPRLTPSSFGLGTAILREVVHPSVRALGGEARSPAHGGVRWAGALSLARFSTEAKDFDSRSPAFSYPPEIRCAESGCR